MTTVRVWAASDDELPYWAYEGVRSWGMNHGGVLEIRTDNNQAVLIRDYSWAEVDFSNDKPAAPEPPDPERVEDGVDERRRRLFKRAGGPWA